MRLTSPLTTTGPHYRNASGSYTIGGAAEARLGLRLALEADALYRRLGYDGPGGALRARRWEFPILLKRRFGLPFAAAGISYHRLLASDPAPELRHRSAWGPSAAVGLEARWGTLHMSAEIRYTHWGERNFGTRGSDLASKLDQVDLLLGFTVGSR